MCSSGINGERELRVHLEKNCPLRWNVCDSSHICHLMLYTDVRHHELCVLMLYTGVRHHELCVFHVQRRHRSLMTSGISEPDSLLHIRTTTPSTTGSSIHAINLSTAITTSEFWNGRFLLVAIITAIGGMVILHSA